MNGAHPARRASTDRLSVAAPLDGQAFQARFDALAQAGMDVHREASLVRSVAPSSVLDVGCGTGRVAIELALVRRSLALAPPTWRRAGG